MADAGRELSPKKTIRIGTFGDYELADERAERFAFKVLLDGLHTSEELRSCIIVRLAKEVVADEAGEAREEAPLVTDATVTPDEPSDPQPADLLKLIDKWKSELTDKFKIRDDRVIVLFAAAREDEGNSLETWIVPSGALLPDPDAELAEESSEESSVEAEPVEAERLEPKPVEAKPVEPEPVKEGAFGGVHLEEGKADKVRPDKPQPDKAQPTKTDSSRLLSDA